MVSPFYLGRNPADEAGGQYPGKAISGGNSRYNAPPEFVSLTDDFDTMWDLAAGGLATAVTGLPQMYLDEQKKAWRSIFTVSGGFDGQVDIDPYMREISGDPEQYYGAADFKIDPITLLTDPKAQLKSIWKAALNTEDMRREGRDRLMRALVSGEGVSSTGSWQDKLLDKSLSSFERRYEAKQVRAGLIDGTSGGSTPLSVFGDRTTGTPMVYHIDEKAILAGGKRAVRTDSRNAFAQAFVGWTRKEDGQNNSVAFGKFVRQAGTSFDDIFKDPNSDPDTLINHVLTTQYGFTPGSAQYVAAQSQLRDAHDRFTAMHKANEGIGKFFGGRTSAYSVASNALNSVESARIVPGVPGVPINIGGLASDLDYKTAEAGLRGLANPLADMALTVHNVQQSYLNNPYISDRERARVQKWANSMNKQITALASSADPKMTAAQLVGYKQNSNANALDAFADAFGNAAKSTSGRRKVSGVLSSFNYALGGANDFQPGLNTELTKIFLEHHILPNKKIAGFSSAGTLAGGTVFGRQVRMYSLAARDSYNLNYHSNLYAAIKGGKVGPVIFKSRFLNALPAYTPQRVVKRFLTANHYFGLRVDQDSLDSYAAWVESGRPARQFSVFQRPGNRFVYGLSKSKTFGAIFQNKFTIDLGLPGIGGISAVGGSHFKAVGILNPFRTSFGADNLHFMLHDGIAATAAFADHNAMLSQLNALMSQHGLTESQAFISLLMNTTDANTFKTLFGQIPFASSAKTFAQLEEFRNWLQQNKFDVFDANGNFDPTKLGNLESLLGWLQARSDNPSYLSITASTVGLVEKLTERLNLLQDKIYNFEKFGFKFGKLFFWQQEVTSLLYNSFLTLVDKIISRLTSKVVTGFVVSATGGLAGFLAPLIDKLLYFIATNIVGKISKGFSGLLQGDFTGLGNAIQGSVQFLIKVIAYTCLAVALLLMFPLLFTNFITSNLSPKAPFAYNNLQASNPINVADGVDVVPNACPSGSLANGALSEWNPSYHGVESEGHGSNNYWDSVSGAYAVCSFPIPGVGNTAWGPTAEFEAADPVDNYCGTVKKPTTPKSPYYGLAWDVGAPGFSDAGAGKVVCAPALGEVSYWKAGYTTYTGKGARLILNGFSSSDKLIYKLLVLHLEPSTVVKRNLKLAPGDGIGKVWQSVDDDGKPDGNSHIHLELEDVVQDIPVAPESVGIQL